VAAPMAEPGGRTWLVAGPNAEPMAEPGRWQDQGKGQNLAGRRTRDRTLAWTEIQAGRLVGDPGPDPGCQVAEPVSTGMASDWLVAEPVTGLRELVAGPATEPGQLGETQRPTLADRGTAAAPQRCLLVAEPGGRRLAEPTSWQTQGPRLAGGWPAP